MEGIIIKEIIEENFPDQREAGLRIERAIRGARDVMITAQTPEMRGPRSHPPPAGRQFPLQGEEK